MKKNKDIQEELEQFAPNLAKLEKENPFKLPPDYFKQMQAEVMGKIQSSSQAKAPSFWGKLSEQFAWLFSPKPAFAMVAFGVVLFLLFNHDNDNQIQPEFLFEGLSSETITAYIEDNIESFESSDLMELAEYEAIDLFDNPDSTEDYIDEIINDLREEDIIDIY